VVPARKWLAHLRLAFEDVARVAHGSPLAVLLGVLAYHLELLLALLDIALGVLDQALELLLHVGVSRDVDRPVDLSRLSPQPLPLCVVSIVAPGLAQRPPVIRHTISIVLALASVD